MNWEKINKLYSCGMQVVKFIGGRNIIFFGLFGTAVTTDLLLNYYTTERPYYGFHIFKRVKPTQTVYEHPY